MPTNITLGIEPTIPPVANLPAQLSYCLATDNVVADSIASLVPPSRLVQMTFQSPPNDGTDEALTEREVSVFGVFHALAAAHTLGPMPIRFWGARP